MSNPAKPKENLANLASIPRKFKPVLVNENPTGEFIPNDPTINPTRDELIKLIILAIPELAEFIDAHNHLKLQIARLIEESDMALNSLHTPDFPQLDLPSAAASMADRNKQMLALIRNIASNIPASRVKETAETFLSWKGISLVNQSSMENGHAATSQEV